MIKCDMQWSHLLVYKQNRLDARYLYYKALTLETHGKCVLRSFASLTDVLPFGGDLKFGVTPAAWGG